MSKEQDNKNQFKEFVEYLIKEEKNTDPDVLLFYGVFQDDAGLVEKALQEGANVKVTDTEIIKRYKIPFVRFTSKDNFDVNEAKAFDRFVDFLINEKKVTDPDVLLFYAIAKDDLEIAKKALQDGANPNVTDKQIIKRYLSLHFLFEKRTDCQDGQNGNPLPGFLDYLISKKEVNDPDVLYYRGILKGDIEAIEAAIQKGADDEITEEKIIDRYRSFYDEFNSQNK